MLVYCWPTVCDAGPTLHKHCVTNIVSAPRELSVSPGHGWTDVEHNHVAGDIPDYTCGPSSLFPLENLLSSFIFPLENLLSSFIFP